MRTPIPWLRLLAEGIVVIGSILIAFAIDAWWARRQTDALERELLSRLEAGFEENQRLAEERIANASFDQTLLRRFIAMTPSEAEKITPDSTQFFLRALSRPPNVRLNSEFILATLDAARLSLAPDPQLLTALAYWEAELRGLTTRNDILYSVSQQVTYNLARHPELQPVLVFEGLGHFPGSVTRVAREDNEVMAGATSKARAVVLELQYLERIKGAAAEVLSLVRTNLER